MVTKKGRRNMLIRQIREVIYDIGRPATAREILDNCAHMKNAPTMNQLCGMMRRRSEFIITDNIRTPTMTGMYGAHLYWVANTDGISEILKCKKCGESILKLSNGSRVCSECYKHLKRKERAECGKA